MIKVLCTFIKILFTKVCREFNLEQMLVDRFFDFENFATYYSNLLEFPGRILSRARDDPFRGISLHSKLKHVRLQQMAFSKRK
jgi:hypothetical protein